MPTELSTPQVANLVRPSRGPEVRSRLLSLDLFRGATIAAMILVNNPGDESSSYWPLRHAQWNGWTPTDLIFPFFLFIVGVAMAFSFPTRLERGATRPALMRHVVGRGVALFAIGMFLNGFPNHYQLDHWRVYGVLQRIALCYVLVAILELWTTTRTQVLVSLACLAGYWLLMRYVSVPGFGTPTRDIPLLDPDRNLVAWLDRRLLMGHLYEGTRDPEGLLSTIPALATCLAGLLTGKWLRRGNTPLPKTLGLLSAGIILLLLGKFMDLWFPINKKLWTSSFVVFTAGAALLLLALFYWLADVKNRRGLWTRPILVFGTNAILAYFFAEVAAHLLDRLTVHGSPLEELIYSRSFALLARGPNASLLYALSFVVFSWAVVAVFYRKRVFIKI
jgi:predicted acyltransferase